MKEMINKNIINYNNGYFWGVNEWIYNKKPEEEKFVEMQDEDCKMIERMTNKEISAESLNKMLFIFREKEKQYSEKRKCFSAMLFLKRRRVDFTDNKYKIESEYIVRLVLKNESCQLIHIDIPYIGDIIRMRENIEAGLKKIDLDECAMEKDVRKKRVDVILSPRAAGYFIHEIIGHPLEVDFVKNGLSLYSMNDVGKRILSKNITIFEKPDAASCVGLFFGKYDDLGKKLEDKLLVKDGVIQGFIDNYRCDSLKNKCMPRMYNLCLESNGKKNVLDMIRETDYGLLIDNIISGKFDCYQKKFSLYCDRARVIERGEIVGVIEKVVIEDEVEKLKDKIRDVGNDIECMIGECMKLGQIVKVGMTAPSIKMEQINIDRGI